MDQSQIKLLVEIKSNEHDVLFEQLNNIDQKKISMQRMAFVTFSVITTGFIAGFAAIDKIGIAMDTVKFAVLFAAILVGIGVVNLSIIKNIIAFKHQRIFISRQLNCARHAVDGCFYYMFHGEFPSSHVDLLAPETGYYKAIGKHRKLPIVNKTMREYHSKVFESADNFLITVITLITTIVTVVPVMYILFKFDSSAIGFAGGIFIVCFIAIVLWIGVQERKNLNNVLYANKHDLQAANNAINSND